MVRAAVVAATVVGVAALSACGGDGSKTAAPTTSSGGSPSTTAGSGSPTSSASSSLGPTTTAVGGVATPAPPPPPLPAGCTPPAASATFASGVATVEISSGPGTGRLDLAVQPRSRNEYEASSKQLKGEWEDGAGRLLYVNFSGGDPCKDNPSAFVRIESEGPTGKAFVDSARNRCKVELKAFSASGFDGSFSCTQLAGGGEGVYIDATGTFSSRP